MHEQPIQPSKHEARAAAVLPVLAQESIQARRWTWSAERVSAELASLSRFVGCGRRLHLSGLQADVAVHLAPQRSHDDWTGDLALSTPRGPIEIEDGVRLLRALTGIDIGTAVKDASEHWRWLQSAVLARLAGTPFDACDCILPHCPSATSDAIVLRLVFRTCSHQFTMRARAGTAVWLHLLTDGSWSPLRQPLVDCLFVPVESTVRIGSHVLSAGQLRTLGAGDILVPESPRFNAAGDGWIAFGRIKVHVRFAGTGMFSVLGVARRSHAEQGQDDSRGFSDRRDVHLKKGKTMNESYDDSRQHTEESTAEATSAEAEAGDSAAPDALDAVDIALHFELGKVQMSLGDMRALTAGSIVLFQGGSPESVAIVASGRTLGSGEVVDVEGRLGIRITQWGAPSEQPV